MSITEHDRADHEHAKSHPPQRHPGMNSQGQGLRLLLAALMAVVIGWLVLDAERQLHGLFQALAAHQAELARIPASASPVGGSFAPPGAATRVEPLPGEVHQTLRQWFEGWPDGWTSAALWRGFNLMYLGQLGYTLLLLLPAGLLIALIAFAVGQLLYHLHRRGRIASAGTIDSLLDALPYILWLLPALSLAYLLWDEPYGLRFPYWSYLAIIFIGFGVFLLPFHIHTNRQRLLVLDRNGLLDGERATGMSEWRIVRRLLRFEMRRLFLYQALYASLFMMLMEFAAFEIVEFDQPRQRYTLFTQANILAEQAQGAVKDAAMNRELSHLQLLDGDIVEPPSNAADWAARLAITPAAALNPAVHRAIVAHAQASKDSLPAAQRGALSAAFEQRPADQQALFFGVLSGAYFRLNLALVLGLFAGLFVWFDLRAYLEETHG
jgi:hypothetical protein